MNINKRVCTGLLSLVMIGSLATPVFAVANGTGVDKSNVVISSQVKPPVVKVTNVVAPNKGSVKSEVKSFSDVPEGHWAHEAIMDMVSRGMFSGVTEPCDGVGTFAPNNAMSRAEAATVIARAFYSDILADLNADLQTTVWWSASYSVLLQQGILSTTEFDGGDLKKPITREEMAMLLVRVCEAMGEDVETMASPTEIPDFNTITRYYSKYVRTAYHKGLIAGTDSKGTFTPQGQLTRSQGAMMLYRLVEKDTRAVDKN